MSHSTNRTNMDDLASFIEPVFYYGLKKSSKIPDCLIPKLAFNCFEYRLKQNPKDLSCHLQRIQFALSEKNKDEVFAAICDIFIILGAQGLPLRQRLLSACKKTLDQNQIKMLSSYLLDKILGSEQVFLPDNCFFKKKPLKLIQLRDQLIPDTQLHEDVLNTADSYIENSQFETALEYMTSHIEHDPENRELTIKLIELYKALNYNNEFQSAYEIFSNHLLTSQYWDNAKQYFVDQQQTGRAVSDD